MQRLTEKSAVALTLLCSLVLVWGGTACRKGTESGNSVFNAIPPSTEGVHGCLGADQVFTPPQLPTAVTLSTLAIGEFSQIAAVQGEEELYATGAGATIVAINFAVSAGSPPDETLLVGAEVVDDLLATVGIATAAELSGIAVVDAENLLVVEHTSNTLLLVSRTVPDSVSFYAGLPDETPGFSDGVGTQIRFSFEEATQIVSTADGRVFIADSGNHAIRMVMLEAFPTVFTVCGTGAAGHQDGGLAGALFDTPVALSVGCNGWLLITEAGTTGLGGHRIRSLAVGDFTFFGVMGTVMTMTGDGTLATVEGIGEGASLAMPRSLVSTEEGDLYWIDSATGILRRHDSVSAHSDCPLFTDCATAVGGPANFTPGGTFSMTMSAEGGVLYILDSAASTLWRVTP
jgi:hypothetical protein